MAAIAYDFATINRNLRKLQGRLDRDEKPAPQFVPKVANGKASSVAPDLSPSAVALAICLMLPVGAWADYNPLPDPKLTPGIVDTTCTAETLRTTTTTGRRTTTAAMKAQAYTKYGLGPRKGVCGGPRGCEVDHRQPLEACGADVQENLWIMPYDGPCNASDKDQLENQTKRDILAGKITLGQAQQRFAAPDWRVEYQKRFGKSCADK